MLIINTAVLRYTEKQMINEKNLMTIALVHTRYASLWLKSVLA